MYIFTEGYENVIVNIFSYLDKRSRIIFSNLNKDINNIFWYQIDKRLKIGYHNYNFLSVTDKYITEIIFENNFITQLYIKNNIKYLNTGICFNKELSKRTLPEKLEKLVVGDAFDQNIDNLPENIEYLFLGFAFNNEIKKLPKNLKRIRFGWYFNQSVDNFPPNLESVIFTGLFNQHVDKLPQIKYIQFGECFNKSIDNLPDSVEEINFVHSSKFHQEINKLPKNIKKITFHSKYLAYINMHFFKTKWCDVKLTFTR
jgi:hypothetical protein